MGGFAILLVLAALIAGAVIFALIAWRTQKLLGGKPVGTEGWLNRAAHGWHTSIEHEKQRRAHRQELQKSKAQTVPVDYSPASFIDADEELEDAFGRFNRREIDLDGYREIILEVERDARERLASLREDRRLYDAEDYAAEKAEIESALEAARWRLRWVDERRHRKDEEPGADSGRWARFEYVDADGAVTRREIVNWEARGRYIVGFDRRRGEERTFHRDRVRDWKCG